MTARLLMLLALLPFLCGFSGRVFLNGDDDVAGTELNASLAAVGFVQISTGAEDGSSLPDLTDSCSAAENYDMQSCRTVGTYQAAYHDGECRSYTSSSVLPLATIDNTVCGTTGNPVDAANDEACCGSSTCVPSCIADQARQATDVCLIMAGTVEAGEGTEWAIDENQIITADDGTLEASIDGLRLMLSENDRSGVRCVVATSFPRRGDSAGTFFDANLRIFRDLVRKEVEERPRHLFFDTIALVDLYEAENGTAATDGLYTDCPSTCQRPGTTPNSLGESGFSWLGDRLAKSLKGLALSRTVAVQPPNILFVVIDDLGATGENYWPDLETPNIDALAAAGVDFRHAYSTVPICNPSRASVLIGKSPDTTGIYINFAAIRNEQFGITDLASLPQRFRDQGYRTLGTGKVFHLQNDDDPHTTWDIFTLELNSADLTIADNEIPGDVPSLGLTGVAGTDPNSDGVDFPFPDDFGIFEENDAPTYTDATEDMPDYERVSWARDQIDDVVNYPQPVFLAVGLYRPHFPHYCPKLNHDGLPATVTLGPHLTDDLLDVDDPQWNEFFNADLEFEGIENEAAKAYMACVEFADDQLGRLIEKTDASSEDWLIVLWGDHGYQLDEKERWSKFTLWERGSRTRWIMAGPGIDAAVDIDVPVSLLDMYPTVADFAGIPVNEVRDMDGSSARRFVDNPSVDNVVRLRMDHPTEGEYTGYVSRDYKYILCNERDDEVCTSSEFYELDTDPNEWTNVTGDSAHDAAKAWLVEQGAAP